MYTTILFQFMLQQWYLNHDFGEHVMIILFTLQVIMVMLRLAANTSAYNSKARSRAPFFINDLQSQSQDATFNKVLKQSRKRCQSHLKFSKILNFLTRTRS